MKTLIAMMVGGIVVLGLFLGVISSNNFVLNSQTLLKSPKINVETTTNNLNTHQKMSNINKGILSVNSSMSAFSQLIRNDGLLYGTVSDGANIIIPCSEGVVKGGELVVPEYYTNMPWEKFTDYITANGNGSYTIEEYYNKQHTAEMDLNIVGNQLKGTFIHISNNKRSNVTFTQETYTNKGNLTRKPFYIGVIGQGTVVLTNCFNGTYTESYHRDKLLMTVKKANGSSNSNYGIQLNVYLGKNLVSQFYLNNVGNDTYTGIYVLGNQKMTVGLTGSNSPFSV